MRVLKRQYDVIIVNAPAPLSLLANRYYTREFFEEAGTLGPDGQASFDASIPDDLSPPAALEAIVTARVREGGGRGVTGLARIPVHVYATYPGLKRLASDAATPGKPSTSRRKAIAKAASFGAPAISSVAEVGVP